MMSTSTREAHRAVSPKMIEAGLHAMKVWQHLPPGELVAAVYRAMAAHVSTDRQLQSEPVDMISEILNRFERKP